MARTVVWATQASWQRLAGFAFTTEEDLLKNTPKIFERAAPPTAAKPPGSATGKAPNNVAANTAVKKEDDSGCGMASVSLEHDLSPRRKIPKIEGTYSDSLQFPGNGSTPHESFLHGNAMRSDICLDPDCSLPAIETVPGLKVYCAKHSKERPSLGMTQLYESDSIPVPFKCRHPGCEKFSTPAEDGERCYCLTHMSEYGQLPVLKRRKCQHPACQKQARKSSEGQTLYCKGHMKQHGLSPNVPKCRHVNCGKQAQLSVDGQTLFCKVHMKENGLIPRQRVCAEGSCQKRVKQSLQGPGMFCIAHMKLHGLTPKLRLCQNTECSKQAVPDVDGKRLYCVAHMKEHGMEPYFRLRKCQAPNCDKKAKSDTGGKKTFCTFHAKVFEELQNSALVNYQTDGDEDEE